MSAIPPPRRLPEGDLDCPFESVDEAGVTELRVHGVGGTAPEKLLGDPHPQQITGDRIAGMWRGAGESVGGEPRWHREAYSWGGLTSKALVSALWLMLLPFAVLNLAGWTAAGGRPGPAGEPDWRVGYQHSLVRILGLMATWTYVLFAALLAMDLGGWQCARTATPCRLDRAWQWLGLTGHPARASVVAALVPVLMIVVLGLLSRETARRYEEYRAAAAEPEPLPLASVRLTDTRLWLGGGYAMRERAVHIASSLLVPAALLLFVAEDGGRFPSAAGIGLMLAASLAVFAVLASGINGLRRLVFRRFWPPVLVALAVLGFAATLAWLQPARDPTRPELMPGTLSMFNGLLVAVYTAALLLGVVALVASRRAGRNGWVGMTYGLPGSYLAVVVAVLLLFAVWSGVAVWVARALSSRAVARRATAPTEAIVYPGPFEWLAFFAVCLFLILLVVVGSAALVSTWRARRSAWSDLGWERECWGGHELPGARRVSGTERAPAAWLRTVRWWQWLAGIARWFEAALVAAVLLTTVSVLGYSGWFTWQWFGWGLAGAVGALAALGIALTILVRGAAGRWRQPGGPIAGVATAVIALAVAAGVAWWLSGMDGAGRPDPPPLPAIGHLPIEGIITTLLALVPVASVLLVRQAIASPSTRRTVGVAWDVATFWPRAFHPLAPPSYAERAVPELTTRVRGLLERGNAVLLAGHSQGALLTLAAVAQLADLPAEHRERLSVVTYGNPSVNLYQRWFPAYVNRRLIDEVTGVPSGWVNFFRYTDPVGRELFAAYRRDAGVRPPIAVTGRRCDCWLPDPPTDLRRPGDGVPVRRGHGQDGYLRQSAFRGHLAAEARRLATLTRAGSGDAGRAELDADPRPDRPGGLRDGVLPRPLAGAAHDDEVAVTDREP